jgi:uncharacterized protein YfaS (alpha-2-macroglobulin family)
MRLIALEALMKSPFVRVVALSLVFLIGLSACLPFIGQNPPPPSTPTPTVPPTPQPARSQLTQPNDALSPIVVAHYPASGAKLAPSEALEVVFDRPMDEASVNAAFSISPQLEGKLEWSNTQTLRFTPSQELPRNAVYQVSFTPEARDQQGQALNDAYRFQFVTNGYLEASQVFPEPNAQAVNPHAVVSAMFSRPVVSLGVSEQAAQLPAGFTIEPAVEGVGEWLNTSTYIFRPNTALASGTEYRVTINPALTDIDGNPLQSDFSWSFGTARPEVLEISPANQIDNLPLDLSSVRTTFNQAIDPQSAQAAFRLEGNGAAVPGELLVLGETLIFTPSARLAAGTSYSIAIDQSLRGIGGGQGLQNIFSSSFKTVEPLSAFVESYPKDGESIAPESTVTLRFNAPIDPNSIAANIQFSPAVDFTKVYSYVNAYDNTITFFHNFSPATDYQLTISPGLADPYGNTLGSSHTINFRVLDYEPRLSLIGHNVRVMSANQAPRMALQGVNKHDVEFSLHRIDVSDLKDGVYRDWSTQLGQLDLVRKWVDPLPSAQNERKTYVIGLSENNAPLAPGLYLFSFNDTYLQTALLVVSDVNVTLKSSGDQLLIWANSISSGQPLPNLQFETFDYAFERQDTVTTDAQGVARSTKPAVTVISSEPFALFSSDWNYWADMGSLGVQIDQYSQDQRLHIETDRPIYRPDSTVYFQGTVRQEQDVHYSMPNVREVQLSILSPNGESVYEESLPLNANGSFAGELRLGANAMLGQYQINVVADSSYFNQSFMVAAYRLPEFEVSVTPNEDNVVRGNAIQGAVDVQYYFGSPVANQALTWNVSSQPYYFEPSWASGYSFISDDTLYLCRYCWWQPKPSPELILQGTGSTNAEGEYTIALPAQLMDSENKPITKTVQLLIEASVLGNDNQQISGRSSVIVHAGERYVGLRSQNYVSQANQELIVDVVSANAQGERLASQTVDVEIFRVTWVNERKTDEAGNEIWNSREERELVERQQVSTNAQAQGQLRFTPSEGGRYRVVASIRDNAGNVQSSTISLWVLGSDTTWLRDNTNTIELVADKNNYTPGETARVLIPSPYERPHLALLSVERGEVLSYEVRQVQGSFIYEVPITAEHAPNIYISVVLFDNENQKASYKIGTAPITVETNEQLLNVTISGDSENYQPGQTARFEVQVNNPQGQGVAAELSLDVVDKAALSLQPRTPNAIKQTFYSNRPLGVITSNSHSLSQDDQLDELEKDGAAPQMGTGNAGGEMERSAPAAADTAMPSAAAPMAEESSMDAVAGAAPQAQAQGASVRENFADTAYWQAQVQTDASGKASFELQLPDNLGTWVVRAVAANQQTQVGEGTSDVIAAKPLMIRPMAPRFFVVGDKAELFANVSNTTDQALETQVSLSSSVLNITSQLTQTVTIPAKGETQVTWQVEVPQLESADLLFTAQSGQYQDASRPTLATGPNGSLLVHNHSSYEFVGTGGQLGEAGGRSELVVLPPNVDTRYGNLRIKLDPSLTSVLRDSLQTLEADDFETIDGIAAQFAGNLVIWDVSKKLGVNDPALDAKMPELVQNYLNQLQQRQHADGGWGWYYDPQFQESNPYISAQVVHSLILSQDLGFAVNDDMFVRSLMYLQSQDRQNLNLQAWISYILSLRQRADGTMLNQLYEQRAELSTYAQAFLVQAMHHNGGDHSSQIATLLSDFNSQALTSATGIHWEEREHDYYGMSSNVRTTGLVLLALQTLRPDSEQIPQGIRWLLMARKGSSWYSSQETMWSLMSLGKWMEYTKELEGNYDYAVWVNQQEQGNGHIDAQTIGAPIELNVSIADLLADQSNRISIARGEGPGRLYYTLSLQAFQPVEQIQALDSGILVQRRYVRADCQDGSACPSISEFKVGDEIRVELSISLDQNTYYLRVEDPIPAGTEALNMNLDTTSMIIPGPQLQQSSSARGRYILPPWWNWYNHSEQRDDKVVLSADYLSKGTYTYSYIIRANFAGEYKVLPSTAYQTYFADIFGRSEGMQVRITR